jgi:hypothetical protein
MQNDIAEFKPDVIIFMTILALICVLQNGQEKHPNTLLHIAPNMGLEENRITDIKRCR